MYDVFISHSSKDKDEYIYKLRNELKLLGHEVWLDADIILTGDNILDEIKKGIEESLCVVLVLTRNFFSSNWTALEVGLASVNPKIQIIPVVVDMQTSEIADKFPFLLTMKYLPLGKDNIVECAKALSASIIRLRNRHTVNDPLNYRSKVRQLNNFDSPITNRLSILIAEYEQICKISVDAGILHTSKIANSIIDDLYMRTKRPEDSGDITYDAMLDVLLVRSAGMNQGVYEHLKLLISNVNSQKTPFMNDADKKKMFDLSLAAVLDWFLVYISAFLRKNKSDERIEAVWYDEMTFQDFVDMHEIDKLVLRPDLIALPEVSYKWYQYNNYSHIAVRSSATNKIVGYFVLFPVTDELFDEIKSGNFKDNELDIEGIRRYDFPDFYKLYVACVCVHPDYQNTVAFHKLYNSLIKMMFDLATEREAYITEIITEASTPHGLKLCKILGLKKIMDTNIDTEIYGTTLLPPSLRLNSNFGSKLIRFYQDKYAELGDLF
jgi:hypothetical protein